jgi:protoheme IX farnesyltransferase
VLKDYYYLTKPGIIYSNVLTVAAGFLLASKHHIDVARLVYVLLGTSLIIAGACVFNNYIDRDIDARMARTKQRALVSGVIAVRRALIFATVITLVGFAILIVHVNWLTVLVGVIAFVDYIVIYGIAKRRSEHGTLVGTVAGAAPIVAGYTAATDHFNLESVLLLLTLTFWQMAHFYAIAIYRLADYKKAGLPVWPAKRGIAETKRYIIGYAVAFVIAAFALTVFGYTGYIYLAVMALAGWYWLSLVLDGLQVKDDKQWARQVFLRSLIVIVVFSGALMVGARLP